MSGKILLVLVVVAVIAVSLEAAPKKAKTTKKPTHVKATTPSTTTTAAPVAVTPIWDDEEYVDFYVSGINRMLIVAVRDYFKELGYKYNTKSVIEANIDLLLNANFDTVQTKQHTLILKTLKAVLYNLEPAGYIYY